MDNKKKWNFKFSNHVLFLVFMLIIAVLISGAVSAAGLANSSANLKFQHDNKNTGQSQYKGPQTNKTKWKYNTEDEMYSTPAIGPDGTIYLGSYYYGRVYAMNPNGTLKWEYQTEWYADNDGIDSSPVVGPDGTIYIQSDNFNDSDGVIKPVGYLNALNPNGTLKWKYQTGGGAPSPVIGSDGTIYVESSDDNLYALNFNGTLKWKYPINCCWSSPAIGSDGTVYVGSECLYAIASNGTLKWKYLTKSGIDSSPVIGSDGTIYVGSYDCNLYAINPDGTLKWKYKTGGGIHRATAIGSDGTVYVGSADCNLYAITPNGKLKWKYHTKEGIDVPPVIGSDGTIYVDSGYEVYALNFKGALKWKYHAEEVIISAPSIGPDGTLYFGSAGYIYAIADRMVSAKPDGGIYNTSKTITLTMNKSGNIYWRYYSSKVNTTWFKYVSPIKINKTSIIQFYAQDTTGNNSSIYTEKYIIDKTAPKIVSSNLNKSKKVSRKGVIAVKFSEKIKRSTKWSKVVVRDKNGKKVKISKIWIRENKLYIKTKKRNKNSSYFVYIPYKSVQDYAGNKLVKGHTFHFKTGSK